MLFLKTERVRRRVWEGRVAEARWGCVAAGSDWGFCCLSLLLVRKEIIEEVLRLDLIEPESLS